IQLRPAPQAVACRTDLLESANPPLKVAVSTSRRLTRATSCRAPHLPAEGTKKSFGVTFAYVASSPVTSQEPVTLQAEFSSRAVTVGLPASTLCTPCRARTCSARIPA